MWYDLEIPHGHGTQITSPRDAGGTRMRATKQAPINIHNRLHGVLEGRISALRTEAALGMPRVRVEILITRLGALGRKINNTLWEIKRLHHNKVRTQCGRVSVDTSIGNLRSTVS